VSIHLTQWLSDSILHEAFAGNLRDRHRRPSAGLVAVPLFINVDSFRPDLEKKLSAALNRQVHIGKLDASLLSGGASATDITIADDRPLTTPRS